MCSQVIRQNIAGEVNKPKANGCGEKKEDP